MDNKVNCFLKLRFTVVDPFPHNKLQLLNACNWKTFYDGSRLYIVIPMARHISRSMKIVDIVNCVLQRLVSVIRKNYLGKSKVDEDSNHDAEKEKKNLSQSEVLFDPIDVADQGKNQ